MVREWVEEGRETGEREKSMRSRRRDDDDAEGEREECLVPRLLCLF